MADVAFSSVADVGVANVCPPAAHGLDELGRSGHRWLLGLQLKLGPPPQRGPTLTSNHALFADVARWQAIFRLLNAYILKIFSFIIIRKFKVWMFLMALIPKSAR